MSKYKHRKRVKTDLDNIEILPTKVTVQKLMCRSVSDKENQQQHDREIGKCGRKQCSSIAKKNVICGLKQASINRSFLSPRTPKQMRERTREPLGEVFINNIGQEKTCTTSFYQNMHKTPGHLQSCSFDCSPQTTRVPNKILGILHKWSSQSSPSKMSERRGTKGLELWCKKMTEGYPGVKIDNMTTSWRDGLAFCAIIHHFRPDLIDFSKLNKDDVYQNNELAFRIAEQYLGIPALLEPEDMVEYLVPDRLSILTYLSQFYQAFAVPQGGSAARVAPKRPQTVPDHGIVSPASTSPPTKMALVGVGKQRRETCTKCSLPVFVVERVRVGKLHFHRTCFRCARCNSQLALAEYYETENGEFCCESCPDEEKKTTAETLLNRSLSDEEKTASLKMISHDPDDFSTEFETALENLQGSSRISGGEFADARSRFFRAQMESGDSGQDEEPPDLPKTSPPQLGESDKTECAALVSNSAHNDSGFSAHKLDDDVNSSVSANQCHGVGVALPDESRNIITKDDSAHEKGGVSLVKARMRLFENNTVKSDSQKVPKKTPTKSHIPIVTLEELENFDDRMSEYDLAHSVSEISQADKDELKRSKYVSNRADEEQRQGNIRQENEEDDPVIEIKDVTNESTEQKEEDGDASLEESDQVVQTPVGAEQVPQSSEEKPENGDVTLEKAEVSVVEILDSTEEDVIVIENTPLKRELVDYSLERGSKDNHSPSQSVEDTFSSNVSIVISDEVSEGNIVEEAEKVGNIAKEAEKGGKIAEEAEEEGKIAEEAKKVGKIAEEPEEEGKIAEEAEKVGKITEEVEEEGKPVLAEESVSSAIVEEDYPEDLNPFGDDGEVGDHHHHRSLNPFGSDEDEDTSTNPFDEGEPAKPVASPRLRKKVLPNPLDWGIKGSPQALSGVQVERFSVNPFESSSPLPAVRRKNAKKLSLNPFSSDDEEDNEEKVPVPKPRTSRTPTRPPEPKPRDTGLLSSNTKVNFGSNSSISSGSAYGSARKKKPAPRPPLPAYFDESGNSSLTTSPSRSLPHSPTPTLKHRKSKAPPPPVPKFASTPVVARKEIDISYNPSSTLLVSPIQPGASEQSPPDPDELSRKQLNLRDGIEQEKCVKDEFNRSRQSQDASMEGPTSTENPPGLSVPNKSTHGKWKRRKGQAPSRPVLQKRTIKCLPMSEIRRELEFIEIQMQGLEKQGVRLEQIIREKCEGNSANNQDDNIPIDVEDLILQLFELVNEKNELFRKQTELMYLRRQQRLEEEHADVEYQLRCLIFQPEANKTDSDKAREEELITRLVEIVEKRNEIVERLEMDRVRESKEDDSISNHIYLYTLNREADKSIVESLKTAKDKEKKKHKKEKKSKHKSKDNVDKDKDIDESENYSTLEKKKKKKFALF